MRVLELAALTVAASVTVARLPHAVAHPKIRLSWAAIAVAAVAFLVRVEVSLDAYLGGTNLISLVQNGCAVTAFWLLTQAALNQHRRRPIRWWQLPLLLSAFTIPFFLIHDRGTTRDDFIVGTIAQTGTWLYAGIYMAVFGLIAASLIAGLRRRQARAYRFFLTGSVLIIAACLDEIVSLSLDHFSYPDVVLRTVLRGGFDLLFYPGTILVIIGVASFSLFRSARDRLLQHRIRTLNRIAARLGISRSATTSTRREPVLALYDRVIALRDYEIASGTPLPATAGRQVHAAEQLVMRHLAGPTDLPSPTTSHPVRAA